MSRVAPAAVMEVRTTLHSGVTFRRQSVVISSWEKREKKRERRRLGSASRSMSPTGREKEKKREKERRRVPRDSCVGLIEHPLLRATESNSWRDQHARWSVRATPPTLRKKGFGGGMRML